MELHIYREGSNDRVVKDEAKDSILHYIRAPYKLFSNPPKEVYRGDPQKAPQIATITRDGHWRARYTVAFPGLEEVVIQYPSMFSNKSKFVVGTKEFAWTADEELQEVETGKVLARFDRNLFAIKKKGVMNIFGEGLEMVDIVVVTGITMQYRWEETRRDRRAGRIPS